MRFLYLSHCQAMKAPPEPLLLARGATICQKVYCDTPGILFSVYYCP